MRLVVFKSKAPWEGALPNGGLHPLQIENEDVRPCSLHVLIEDVYACGLTEV